VPPCPRAAIDRRAESPLTEPRQSEFPASQLLPFVGVAARGQGATFDPLSALGLRSEDLADPRATISVPDLVTALERVRALADEPALGWYVGMDMAVTVHGFLGFAVASAATLRESLALLVEFAPIRTEAFAFRLETHGVKAALVADERDDFGAVRDVILLALLVGLWRIGNHLLGREIRESVVRLSIPEPAYYARFAHLPPRVVFDHPSNQLVFDAALLDAPVVTADPASLRLAREQCERILSSPASLVDRARGLVLRSDGGARSLDEVAAALHVSSRTLRRRLSEERLSFRAILERERYRRAVLLLRSPTLSVEAIAEKLGYTGVRSFARAFERWSGAAPAAFRRGVR
jgi:AraC-like DNA-binding protein